VNPAESLNAIQLAWQPEAADYAEAFAARNKQRRVGVFIAVMSVLGAAFAVVALVAKQPGAAACGVVVALGFPLATPLMVKSSTNGLWRRSPALQQPVQLAVDAHGVSGDAPVIMMNPGAMSVLPGGAHFRWTDQPKVLETSRVFVVQPAEGKNKIFFLVAKRGLQDPAQEAYLRRLLTD
jgi:hypothetical protein